MAIPETLVMDARPAERSAFRSWPSWSVAAIIAAAAVYSFAPRPSPPFAPTQVYHDRLLVNGVVRNGTRLVAVGEQGHILIADSPEGPWREARIEPQRGSNFSQVTFVNERVVLAVGHDSWIVRSEDGGETWTEVSFDAERSEPLLAIVGPFSHKLFAIGAFGQYMTSVDQGKTWQRETHEAIGDRHLNAMTRAADGSLFLVGERGLLLRSTDNGQRWQPLKEIYPGSFFGIQALPRNGLIVFGMRGNAFRSFDYGRSWTKSQIPENLSLFGGAVTDGKVVLVGANNTIMLSQDGGARFHRASSFERNGLATVLPLDNGQWLTGGDGGLHLQALGTGGAK